jgi:hypothetical protein
MCNMSYWRYYKKVYDNPDGGFINQGRVSIETVFVAYSRVLSVSTFFKTTNLCYALKVLHVQIKKFQKSSRPFHY